MTRSAEPEHPEEVQTTALETPTVAWLTPFTEAWEVKFTGSRPAIGTWAKHLKPMIDAHGAPEVLARWRRFLERTQPELARAPAFVNGWISFAHDANVAEPLNLADGLRVKNAQLGLQLADSDPW